MKMKIKMEKETKSKWKTETDQNSKGALRLKSTTQNKYTTEFKLLFEFHATYVDSVELFILSDFVLTSRNSNEGLLSIVAV